MESCKLRMEALNVSPKTHTKPVGEGWEAFWSKALKGICPVICWLLCNQAETSVAAHNKEYRLYKLVQENHYKTPVTTIMTSQIARK